MAQHLQLLKLLFHLSPFQFLAIHSSPVPNLVAAVRTECVITGTTVAPASFSESITGIISSYVQCEAVMPRPIRFPCNIYFPFHLRYILSSASANAIAASTGKYFPGSPGSNV